LGSLAKEVEALLLSFVFLWKNLFKGKAPSFSTCFKFYTIDYTLLGKQYELRDVMRNQKI